LRGEELTTWVRGRWQIEKGGVPRAHRYTLRNLFLQKTILGLLRATTDC